MSQIANYDNQMYKELRQIISEKKKIKNPLIEVLREAQTIFGYLPVEVQQFISQELDVPLNKIYGVVTFYNFFSMKPRGKFVINVCTGTACYVKGAPRIIQMMTEELKIEMGETTSNGLFTLSAVRCVGACSLAPVFVIGEETYGRIENKAQVVDILNRYK